MRSISSNEHASSGSPTKNLIWFAEVECQRVLLHQLAVLLGSLATHDCDVARRWKRTGFGAERDSLWIWRTRSDLGNNSLAFDSRGVTTALSV